MEDHSGDIAPYLVIATIVGGAVYLLIIEPLKPAIERFKKKIGWKK